MMTSVQATYSNTVGVENLVYILTDDDRREELGMPVRYLFIVFFNIIIIFKYNSEIKEFKVMAYFYFTSLQRLIFLIRLPEGLTMCKH